MLTKISSAIDALNEFIARWAKWIIIVIVAEMFFDVCMRYFLNRPTIWAYDLSYMLGGVFFTLGLSYVHKLDRHVRVDVFYAALSPKKKAALDVVLSLLVFFPTFTLLLVRLFPYVATSWERREKAVGSFWGPPIYPLKIVVLIAILLLWLQGLSNLIRDIQILCGKAPKEVGK